MTVVIPSSAKVFWFLPYRFADLVVPRLPRRAEIDAPAAATGELIGEAIAADFLPSPSYASQP
jgi:hypothetical protein